MRDPARIEPMLAALRRIWERHPDLRLCQIIVNAARVGPCPDLFYLEDEALLRKLDDLASELRAGGTRQRPAGAPGLDAGGGT